MVRRILKAACRNLEDDSCLARDLQNFEPQIYGTLSFSAKWPTAPSERLKRLPNTLEPESWELCATSACIILPKPRC